MAETSGFFEARLNEETEEYDRLYYAEQFANYFKLFIGNGVFIQDSNQLQVESVAGMNIKVNPGWGFINGYWYNNSEELNITIPVNTFTVDRYDLVVLRKDLALREISIVYLENETNIRRDGNYYDLALAKIRIPVGSASISNSNITDKRPDEEVCGFVKGLVDIITTDALFNQFTAQFNEWFTDIKEKLEEDPAGNLQAQIGNLGELVTVNKDSLVESINEAVDKIDNLSAEDIGAMPGIIAVTEYPYNGITDVLKLPIGRYRFTSQTVWDKFANTPSTTIGIIEVSSVQTGNPDPWTQAWKYKHLLYKSMYSGVMYVRTAASGEVGNINDSGWLKVTTSKNILDTAELISANTVSGNVAGALGVKQIKNALNDSINTLNTNLQNTIYSNGGTIEEKTKWLIENKKLPTNKPFLIREAHSGISILVGHIYDSYNYGGFLIITIGEVYYAKVFNGTLASLTKIGDYAELANRATNDSNGRNIATGYMKHYDGNVSKFNDMLTRGKYLVNGTYKTSEGAPRDGVLYGALYVFLCDDTRTHNNTSTWLMQLLFDTYGNIKIRRKINADGWTSWRSLCKDDETPTGGGIQFQIVNGELQYRYDTEVWG